MDLKYIFIALTLSMTGCVSIDVYTNPYIYTILFLFFLSLCLFSLVFNYRFKNNELKNSLKKSEDDCKVRCEMVELLLSESPIGLLIADSKGDIKTANYKVVEILDLPSKEALESIDVFNYMPFVESGLSDKIIHAFDDKKRKEFDFFYTSKWGKESNLKVILKHFIGSEEQLVVVFIIDTTELENLKEKLKQSHRMESLGVLAGGIVHDFNNILGAIMGYSEMTMLDIEDGRNTRENISQVILACHRAKDLVSHILSFTREEDTVKKPVNLSLIVKETLKLLRASFPATIEINVNNDLEPSLDEDLVHGNATEIHQVLMNLCTNASHAMEGIDGKLDITITSEDISDETFKEIIKSGKFIKLSISDNGHGMDSETVKKIFDPYFTTKEKDHGTGMGLFVVQGIILNHGGVVKAESKSGAGSVFHVYLPALEATREDIIEDSRDFKGSKEKILFVDDEEQLIKLGKQLLERFDYKVTVSMDPTKALDIFRNNPFDFDLVVTDMTMPGITGDILLKEIHRIRPEIPVVICTGYSDLINEEKAKKLGACGYIMKPLGKNELGQVIRAALDSSKDISNF